MGNSLDLKEFVAGFILESDEHLHSVNRNLVATSEALKLGRAEPRAVRELFRSLHTIKGISSMVGAEPIVDISHEMESILRRADRAGGRLDEGSLDLLLQGTRALEERIRYVSRSGVAGIPKPPRALLDALTLAQENPEKKLPPRTARFALPPDILKSLSESDLEQISQAGSRGERAVMIEFPPSPERQARGLNITTVRARLGALGELVKVIPHASANAPTGIAFFVILVTPAGTAELLEAAGATDDLFQEIKLEAEAETRPQTGPTLPAEQTDTELPAELADSTDWAPTENSSVRVDIRRLDEALERLSDLIVTRSKLSQSEGKLAEQGVDTRELKGIIAENARQLKRLRAAITEARMVPLADLLQRLQLVVRGLTHDSAKSVNLAIHAGNAEVDKAVADQLFPVVVHLVRNAVDHAIESREERARAGKPEAGAISIVCDDSSGTSLVLTISDDGRGIDRHAVAKKAGLEPAKSSEELLQQIAAPGLSTAASVTHTSGRGMGMEIVKRTVEMLGGALQLATDPGRGTAFVLRVPVSITIVDVLSFVAGEQVFVVPIAMVDEIIEIDPDQTCASPVPGRQGPLPRLLPRRGEAIPLLGLGELLRPGAPVTLSRKALVVNQHRGAIAFGVDRMLGQQEVVVRPLDEYVLRRPGVSGATDLGNGRPTLVLDLSTLGASLMQEKAVVS